MLKNFPGGFFSIYDVCHLDWVVRAKQSDKWAEGQLGVNRAHIEDNNVGFFKNHLANSLLTFMYIFINENVCCTRWIWSPCLIISTTEVYSKTCSPKLLMYLQDDPTKGYRKSESRVFRDQVEPFQGIALRFKLVLLIGGVMLPSSNWNLSFSPLLLCSRWSSMDRAQCPTDARSWEVETLQF